MKQGRIGLAGREADQFLFADAVAEIVLCPQQSATLIECEPLGGIASLNRRGAVSMDHLLAQKGLRRRERRSGKTAHAVLPGIPVPVGRDGFRAALPCCLDVPKIPDRDAAPGSVFDHSRDFLTVGMPFGVDHRARTAGTRQQSSAWLSGPTRAPFLGSNTIWRRLTVYGRRVRGRCCPCTDRCTPAIAN